MNTGDIPEKVIGIKVDPDTDKIYVRIDWKIRSEMDMKPGTSRILLNDAREKVPDLLLDYYESIKRNIYTFCIFMQ